MTTTPQTEMMLRRPGRHMRDGIDMVARLSDPFKAEGLTSLLSERTEKAPKRRTYPLHDAAKRGDLERVVQMLESGSDPNALNTRRYPPLLWMLQRAYGSQTNLTENHARCIEALVKGGADVNGQGGQHSVTAMHLAASIGHKSLIEFLCRLGADVNAENFNGETPLTYARSGWLSEDAANDVANFLISLGAVEPELVQEEEPEDDVTTESAVAESGLGLVELLHAFLARNESRLDDKIRYVMPVAKADIVRETISIVKEIDATESIATAESEHEGVREVTGAYDELEAEGNAERRNRADVITSAVVNNDEDEVARLIDAGQIGPTVDDPDADGNTLLHYAAEHGAAGVMRLLIDNGADPNAENLTGQTALHRAQSGEIARLLIDAGADVNVVSDKGYGFAPLDMADQPGRHHDLADTLRAAGALTVDQMD